ncbi:MAG TPA: hypothetical protein VLT85_02495 [Terriglobales bacterium]|nr:hypothetical protein [Terriglobales bacterium]
MYEQFFLHPFPLEDVCKLESVNAEKWQYLHGELDLYFALVAGYASGADRLRRRPTAALVKARKDLSQPFFDRYAHLAIYRSSISSESTPHLFHNLELVEAMRKDLLVLIGELLEGKQI